MAKIDKSQYSKQEWRKIKEARRHEKNQQKNYKQVKSDSHNNVDHKTAFVLGNGTSRSKISPEEIQKYGKIYGCNALYLSLIHI